jgi:RNA recognition motif-containing protein
MNIYIANLNYSVNDADLNDLFQEFGEVTSAHVITDRESGRSRGFGFVEMPNDSEALKAIKELNGIEHESKVLTVNAAKPKTEKRDFKNNRRPGGGGGYNQRRY